MGHVLVLNASYQRLNFISLQRAIVLLLKEKAEPIEIDDGSKLHSERQAFDIPIMLHKINGQPIEQGRVGRKFSLHAKVAGCL